MTREALIEKMAEGIYAVKYGPDASRLDELMVRCRDEAEAALAAIADSIVLRSELEAVGYETPDGRLVRMHPDSKNMGTLRRVWTIR